MDKFVEQVARSARLYQRGLITAQEFTNITLEDLHHQVQPCPCECNRGGFCGGCGHAGCGGR